MLNKIALILTIIGAVNWGSIGLFKLDLVALLLGGQYSIASRIVFTLVGIAGLWYHPSLRRPPKRLIPGA